MIYLAASPIISNIAISFLALNLTVICFKKETEGVWPAADTTTFCTNQRRKSSLLGDSLQAPAPIHAVPHQLSNLPSAKGTLPFRIPLAPLLWPATTSLLHEQARGWTHLGLELAGCCGHHRASVHKGITPAAFPRKGRQLYPPWLLTGSTFTQTAQTGIWEMTGP